MKQTAYRQDLEQTVQTQVSAAYCFCDAVIKTVRAADGMPEKLKHQGLLRETIGAYDQLLFLEDDKEKIKETALKKMKLEMEQGDYEQAMQTAETASEKMGGAEEIATAVRQYDEN